MNSKHTSHYTQKQVTLSTITRQCNYFSGKVCCLGKSLVYYCCHFCNLKSLKIDLSMIPGKWTDTLSDVRCKYLYLGMKETQEHIKQTIKNRI